LRLSRVHTCGGGARWQRSQWNEDILPAHRPVTIAPMRVSYSISQDTFVGLQPPFLAIEPLGRALFFFLFLHFVTIFTGVGFVLVFVHIAYFLGQSPPPSSSLTNATMLFGLGVVVLAGVWVAREIIVRNSRKQREQFLRDRYSSLHCRDDRFVETTEDGLLFGCGCKTDSIPWSHFTTLAETNGAFVLFTRAEVLVVPKGAFASEAARTEFRVILSERLSHDRSLTARAIEFACTRKDWHNAQWLQFKAGGWIRLAGLAALAALEGAMILFFVPLFDAGARWSGPFVAGACLFALLIVVLVFVLRRKPPLYRLPLKAWFSEEVIYIQSPIAEGRITWSQISGCIADRRSLILSNNGQVVLLIPQRCIPPAQREHFHALIRKKFENFAA
jgi:hypothetical protein